MSGKIEGTICMRIGMGFDVHGFADGRRLVIGGVTIPHEKGLKGHSDADVLVHAVMDALFGAAALGDIGRHFPDTDPAFKDISSLELLSQTVSLLKEHGYVPVNVDTVIVAEEPKMAPHIPAMRANLAKVMNLDIDGISIKATTTERLGFTGRGEGIAAYAVCLIEKKP